MVYAPHQDSTSSSGCQPYHHDLHPFQPIGTLAAGFRWCPQSGRGGGYMESVVSRSLTLPCCLARPVTPVLVLGRLARIAKMKRYIRWGCYWPHYHQPSSRRWHFATTSKLSKARFIRWKHAANIVLAVAENESGRAGQWARNSNNTGDVGPMQFNTTYLASFARYGITARHIVQEIGWVSTPYLFNFANAAAMAVFAKGSRFCSYFCAFFC